MQPASEPQEWRVCEPDLGRTTQPPGNGEVVFVVSKIVKF